MTIIRSNSISGINSITAQASSLAFYDSTGSLLSVDTGNVNAGVLTATTVRVTGDLTVEGTTTTLDTVVTEVDKLEVNANNSTVGVAITQSGAGDILRLYDGASQVVTVDDQGNFGIGAVTPIQKLHIGGSTLLSNNNYHYGYNSGGSQTSLIGITGSNNVLVGQNNVNHTNTIIYGGTGTIQFSTGGDERIRITSGGQLNINASSESIGGKVIIKNNVDYTATEFDDNPTLYLLNGDQTTGISEASIIFAGRNTGGSTYRAAISGNGSTGLKFYTTSNTDQNDDPAMIIRGSGNIGIGTNNPQANLHIFEGTGSTQAPAASGNNLVIDGSGEVGMSLLFGTDVNTAYGNIYWGNSTDGSSDGRITYFGSTYTTAADRQSMQFRTAGTERLRITSGGNVQVKTDGANLYGSGTFLISSGSTSGRLDVYGGSTNRGGEINFYGGSNNDGMILFRSGAGSNQQPERMRLRGAGSQLLIGTGGDATYNEMTESADHSCVIIGKNAMSNGGLVIRTGNTGTGRIYFADNSGNDPGRNVGSINYYHNGDIMAFTAGGSNTMNMYSGNVRISGPGSTSGTSQSPLAVSSNLGTITAFFGAQTDVRGLTSSQYSSAIRFNGAEVAWGDIAYFPNGDSEYGSFRFGRHGSTIGSYPSASIGVNKVYTTGGIDFKTTTDASGMTSELFDDYEEGTWTPTTTQLAGYTSAGRYTKIGRIVYIEGIITRNTTTAPNAVNLQVQSLPFTVNNISAVVSGNYWLDEGGPSTNQGDSVGSAYFLGSSTTVFFVRPTDPSYQTNARYVQADELTNSRGVSFYGWYRV